ncbi:amidohydrolase [Lacrimispora sp. 210928-DFI.3.58]|uniref:amidohydrolase n=1 Tax=Lacrimispora sp. 210928-DFI.3.58 TaxID=2883214 RepID=UPI001D086CA9|nr:amidohydrolase [Lacrimispora sp. 210928-DFI.3.58]MCB7317969.1 amidohydrolase [Lacrimispora sp. 210928-DFI.3.58]
MKTIYYNGRVYTGSLPLVEAFVVEKGKFLFAGSSAEAKAMAAEGDVLSDLEGHFVCSGFNDSHMHLLGFGNALNAAQLAKHTESLADMISCLKEFMETHPPVEGAWIMGRGWNQDYFQDVHRMPDRHDLDQVSTEVPIYAVRACGHCLVANSKVLELLHVTADTPQPEGGRIGIENGEPDGRFYDNAMDIVYDAIPVPDKETLKNMIRLACKALNSYGVTSSQTDDYCLFRSVPWETVNAAYKELEAAGELTVRVYEQSNFTDLPSLQAFVEAGNITGAGTDRFKIGPLKMLGDGALGARTAFLSRPYADDPTTCGIPVFSQETLDEMICYANEQGMQVAVHTIGDAILDRVLHSIEKALSEHPREDHRHGIVHCQITRPDQLEAISRLKLHVYAQSIFLDYDNHIVEQRVGKELASTSYSWKTLMKDGVSVSNGTDCPVELPDALACIQCAVTRTTLHDNVGPYLPEQKFTVQEALDSYTIRGAEASFEEAVKGRIAPGMLADFVVLGEDPFETEESKIKDIPVLETYVGGRKVFG